jgi:signal transduction histidine kinase
VIEADERRITQHVLVNLVKNAIKFTPQGRIEVGAKPENGAVLFWVADTGLGIPEADRETIFESFRQVDGSLTREAEGSGLGLTIARKFVEMHGGRIWVESEMGRGSTFYFTIPAGQAS